ncbi:MAG: DUF3179 domain-containing protein [Gemmatimonadales bacterium]
MRRPQFAVLGLVLFTACIGDPVSGTQQGNNDTSALGPNLSCNIPISQIIDGGPGIDGIPALHNPRLVSATDPEASYLSDNDRVMGLLVEGQTIAVPLNIQWWHEIVNLDVGAERLAVTHCPLTGSSLVFSRQPVGGVTFGVSGLLFNNNLMMYDRNSGQLSLWPQLSRAAACGPKTGTQLSMVPSFEMSWGAWKAMHPETQVVSSETGYMRNYRTDGYPYDLYDQPNNRQLLQPVPLDPRRPPKERVLGILSSDSDGIALPFGVLDSLGRRLAVELDVGGEAYVVFWDRAAAGAMAFHPSLQAMNLTFTTADGAIVDNETGSTWRLDGVATDGPLAGSRLEPVAEAFVLFWFAWPTFYPDGDLWLGTSGS